jgi:3-hydroxyisobutyrate dehydrogenase-like beta-hydroxyacid dehydrogenase
VKLTGNFLIASAIESLGEALALVRKHGINPVDYVNVITSSIFSAPIYINYGAIIAEEKYEPVGFRLRLGLKDIRLVHKAAEAVSVPMPFASVIHDKFVTAVANGRGEEDWAALARMSAEAAGPDKG